ncbi:hypothetical protein JCM10212_002101, partial [Sporobolomyces blumeae]
IRLRPEHSPPASTAPSSPPTAASPLSPSAPLAFTHSPSPPSSSSEAFLRNSTTTTPTSDDVSPDVIRQLDDFFSQPWVNNPTTAIEVLYIKRASRASDKWSGHVAFPGGRAEPDDESAEFTALRETWEEVGLDLAEREWISIGQLDDREITSSLGKRLLMILSPFVFLHTSPHAPVPELQETEVASAHWIPLELLHAPHARYGTVEIDIATRLSPKNRFVRGVLKGLVGQMSFKCILLPNDPISLQPGVPTGEQLPDLRLWGLTLGMTLDLLSHMTLSRSASDLSTYPYAVSALDRPFDLPNQANDDKQVRDEDKGKKQRERTGPLASLTTTLTSEETSIFPRFSYPDINLLIWLFGWRYRRLVRRSRETATPRTPSMPTTTTIPTYRVNWQGLSLNAYYAAVRRALVVAVLVRAVAAVATVVSVGWYVKQWLLNRRRSSRQVA